MNRKVEIVDERAYMPGNPKCIATHENVPREWQTRDIVERFGIGDHLSIYVTDEEGRRLARPGTR